MILAMEIWIFLFIVSVVLAYKLVNVAAII